MVIAVIALGVVILYVLAFALARAASRPFPSSADEHAHPSVEGGARLVSALSGSEPPARIVTDYFCEYCFAPAQLTPRGARCPKHDHPEVMCEPCGERPAAALHNGLWQCSRCISEGAA